MNNGETVGKRLKRFVLRAARVLCNERGAVGDPNEDITNTEAFQKAVQAAIEAEVSGLKAKNVELIEREKKALERAKAFEGVNPEEYRKLKEAQEKAVEDEKKKSGQWEELKNQLLQKQTEEKNAWEKEKSKLMGQIENDNINAVLTKAIVSAGGEPELLLSHCRPHMKLFQDENGAFVAKVIDPKTGNPRIASGKGDLVTADQLVEEMKSVKALARAFNASGNNGGGTPPGAGSGRGAGGKIDFKALADLPLDEFQQAVAKK